MNIFQHRHRLSIEVWEKIYGMNIPTGLQKQYQVIDSENNFFGILLSPYTKENKDRNYIF